MTNRFSVRVIQIVFVLSALFWLGGCATSISTNGAPQDGKKLQSLSEEKTDESAVGTLLIFSEREAGSESFTTRIFISADYLHMSDSLSPADFVLFNRAERTIYTVTQEDRSIFVIRDKPHNIKPPIDIKYKEESQASSDIPKIDGRQARHYRFYANGTHCYDSVVLGDDFMSDVLAAMREFRQVLANEHAATVYNMPREIMDACDLSINVFHATKHMEHGLPIREWDQRGYQRFLKDYRENVPVPTNTFVLPKNYDQYSLESVQSRGGG